MRRLFKINQSINLFKAYEDTKLRMRLFKIDFAHVHGQVLRRMLMITFYYARSIVNIMPGLTWRDNGHKARLMPVVSIGAA
eukprot:COSAG02_NODE_259_length_26776_cov_1723.750084_14_plen_81_part_00